ncbi:MAG: hypothetical protein L0Z07_01410, partial [Planctomycetes bacterium]|nr:hypothetical protein [Planctomycetota bacterium]
LPKEITTLQKELVRLAAEIENLPDRIDDDRRAIVASRRHDEQLFRNQLHFDTIDSGAWAAYFLHEQLDGPLGELIRTVRWVRQITDAELQPAASARFHGENILFAGCRQAPDLLIRSLELQGSARVAGQGVDVRGLLRNLSSTPALHEEPIRLSLTASGAMPVELQATFDRTRATPRDEFLFTCQGVHLPAARLGQQENVRLALAPTLASLHVTLLVEGDRLSGDIQLAQEQVKIMPSVVGPLAEVPLAVALEDTLSNIHSIELHLSLTGTLDEPTCQLTSHFGPALAEAIGQALQRTAEQHTRVLLAESQQHVDQQLASLERRLAEQRAALLAPLNGSTTLLAQIASELKAVPGLTDERIGRQLSTSPLFR